MELIKEYNSAVNVNGRNYETIVKIFIEQDPDCIEIGESFDFGDDEANKAYLSRFETGELLNTLVSVKVALIGFSCVSGADYLGACHVQSRHLKDDVLGLVADHDMIRNATDDFKKSIQALTQALEA